MALDTPPGKRLEKLFADLQVILHGDTGSASLPQPWETLIRGHNSTWVASQCTPEVLVQEVATLKSRICELEHQLDQQKLAAASLVATDTFQSVKRPMLYETEQLGFLYEENQLQQLPSSTHKLVLAESTVATPILAGELPIGEIQIVEHPQQPLTRDDVELAAAIGQQVATQIQNLRFLEAAERARLEALEATRQFTHKSWEAFMDGIHQKERIGYLYDQTEVKSYLESDLEAYDHAEVVPVLDEQVGRLLVKTDDTQPMNEEDRAFVSSVAQQVGQQVENLRLLADAARARAEAEEATRRLTRQHWDGFAQDNLDELAYVYDTVEVLRLSGTDPAAQYELEQPLLVQGEPIGNLAAAGLPEDTSEARELAATIAAQASLQLETLRLNEELQKRAKALEELDHLKSAFLANMSHELRTPMNSILGFTDVILEGIDGPLTNHMLHDLRLIQKNGQHLLHLINDILDMAKIESGSLSLYPETFNLYQLVDEVISTTSTLANEKNLELFIANESDQELEIFADNTRIRQVLINVVNNAIKFTPEGQISVHISRQNAEAVLVRVQDTGIGIPVHKLEDVFQEFTQVDTSTTRKVGGTGLGLPISRRLVELHGGRLWAESLGMEGTGSTFIMELPFKSPANLINGELTN